MVQQHHIIHLIYELSDINYLPVFFSFSYPSRLLIVVFLAFYYYYSFGVQSFSLINDDKSQEEVGLVTFRRQQNCVVDDINIQRIVYVDGVKLHNVHKYEKGAGPEKENK